MLNKTIQKRLLKQQAEEAHTAATTEEMGRNIQDHQKIGIKKQASQMLEANKESTYQSERLIWQVDTTYQNVLNHPTRAPEEYANIEQ